MCIIILLMPVMVSAQNFPGADPQTMQDMMKKAQEMQVCMQNVDQAKMQAFQQRAKNMADAVTALCSAGKRDEALSKAMLFSKEVASDKAMQQIKRCAEIMKGVMPDFIEMSKSYKGDGSNQHVCD